MGLRGQFTLVSRNLSHGLHQEVQLSFRDLVRLDAFKEEPHQNVSLHSPIKVSKNQSEALFAPYFFKKLAEASSIQGHTARF